MKAVKKLRWKISVAIIAAVFFIPQLQCSNPSSQSNLRWQSVIDVPLTNDSFFLGQQMTSLFTQINGQNITVTGAGRSAKDTGVYYDTTNPLRLVTDTVKGDTVAFSILQTDSISYPVTQDSMASQNYHPRIGPLTIANAATYTVTVPLPAGSFNIPSTVTLSPEISAVVFAGTSPTMPVTVSNSSGANITNLNVTIFGTAQPVGTVGPNSSTTIQVPVAGQAISGGALPVSIQGSSTATSSVTLSFTANGLQTSYAQVMDSLVTFSTLVTNDYNLTDTLNVDYIDILTGSFVYAFHNYTQIPMQINITQLNIWNTAYCIQNNMTSIATLTAANALGLDSSFYFGQTASTPQPILPNGSITDSLKVNLSGLRLFPIWNPSVVNSAGDTGESVSRVVYTVTNIAPQGKMETISAGDSMLFTIRSPNFKFLEMAGTVVRPYVRNGDTAKVAVPFPWDSVSKDSLVGKLILSKVWADIFLTPNLPDSTLLTPRRAFIDTLGINFAIFNPLNPTVQVDSSTTLHNVVNDTIFRLTPTTITSLINQYPDSLYIAIGVKVPVGTYLRAINELTNPLQPNYKLYMGEMSLKANVNARMNAVMAWQAVSSASLDLGTGRFKVPKASRYITKLDGITATVHMNTFNKSNVYLNLYALMASQAHMNALDSLPLDSVWAYIGDSGKAHSAGYIDLLGSNGVQIPARNGTASDTVVLNDWQIDSILESDSAGWRWEARFQAQSQPDALRDTDFVRINSWMHLVGNNNMDSLLIWH